MNFPPFSGAANKCRERARPGLSLSLSRIRVYTYSLARCVPRKEMRLVNPTTSIFTPPPEYRNYISTPVRAEKFSREIPRERVRSRRVRPDFLSLFPASGRANLLSLPSVFRFCIALLFPIKENATHVCVRVTRFACINKHQTQKVRVFLTM